MLGLGVRVTDSGYGHRLGVLFLWLRFWFRLKIGLRTRARARARARVSLERGLVDVLVVFLLLE